MTEQEPMANPESEEVISERTFFLPTDTPEPQNPVIALELVKEQKVQFDRHLASERVIQQYRPRYDYLSAGLTAMGLGLYLANTSVVDADRLSTRQRTLLNLASLGIGTASFLAMKPVGEPRATGEQEMLQKVDSHVRTDTIPVSITDDAAVRLTISRGTDTVVSGREISYSENRIILHLGHETGIQQLPEADTTGLTVNLRYRDTIFEQYIPVTDFMQEFVEVTAANVPVRTAPAHITNNIIRHVGTDSRFPLLSDVDDRWYRILKAGDMAYIQKENTQKIRQVADVSEIDEWVMQPDQPVFGDLEIERNLPDHARSNPDGIAIVIVNGDYRDPVRQLPHSSRTGELVSLYLTRVLGFYSDNIRVFENMTGREMEQLLEESDSLMIGGRYLTMDESDLLVYYYGHAFTAGDDRLYLLPVDYDPGEREERLISFEAFSKTLENLRSRQKVLVMDTDLSRRSVFGQEGEPAVRSTGAGFANRLDSLTGHAIPGAVFWAAQPGQRAQVYSGNDRSAGYPYGIFTWYFFKALREGARTTGDIEQYLQRNVPFTSRRLHEKSQEPGFDGDDTLLLIRE